MAHILTGDWSSRVLPNLSTIQPDEPPVIHLVVHETTGLILPGSVHGADPLTGEVTVLGTRLAVRIVNANRRRVHEGVFCAEIGETVLVLAGRLRTRVMFAPPEGLHADETGEIRWGKNLEERPEVAFVQEQAIWVATKP